jgi:hypothetical protein
LVILKIIVFYSRIEVRLSFGGNMDKKDVRITIDPNGNIHREVIDQTQPQIRKPRLLKRLFASLTL